MRAKTLSRPASSKRLPSTSTVHAAAGERQHGDLVRAAREHARASRAQGARHVGRSAASRRLSGVTSSGSSPAAALPAGRWSFTRSPPSARARTSDSSGIASAHSSREATIAPAPFANRTHSAGGQPASRPWQSAPPNASPAPSPQTTGTRSPGTTSRSSGGGDEHAVAALLDDGEATAPREQRAGRSLGVARADGDPALLAVADGRAGELERRRRSPRSPRPRRARTSAGSRGRGSSSRARGRASARARCRARARPRAPRR